MSISPEIARSVPTNGYNTNCHVAGEGEPVVLIHGSGPGVTAWANWRLVYPEFSAHRMAIMPDMVGFGFTDRPSGIAYGKEAWVAQLLALLDSLGVERTDLIGNSFGGAISLAFAALYPERVRRLVLMGSAGLRWPVTPGLEAVWGYEPSIQSMRALLDIFAFDRSLVTDELAELRYRASIQPGFQEAFAAMFPAPRQRSLDALATDEEVLRGLPHPTLILHGRNDLVVPLTSSERLVRLLPNAELHVFGRCGHWTQIERTRDFLRLSVDFLRADGST